VCILSSLYVSATQDIFCQCFQNQTLGNYIEKDRKSGGLYEKRITRHTDCAGDEQLEVVLLGDFEHVVETFDVDTNSKRDVRFANETQQCTEMHQPVYALLNHQLLQFVEIQDVCVDKWPCNIPIIAANAIILLSLLL